MVAGFEQEEINVGSGENRTTIGTLHKIRLINRKDALDSLARTQGMFNVAKDAAAREHRLCVVEGYMDALMAHQHGFDWTVATLGTALTEAHLTLMRRYAEEAVLVFDGDAAGQTAAERGSASLVPHGLDVRVLLLPHDEDPDSFIQHRGKEAFVKLLNGALNAYQFLIDKAMAEGDPLTGQGKSAIAAHFMPIIQSTPDQIIRQDLIKQLAERLSEKLRTEALCGDCGHINFHGPEHLLQLLLAAVPERGMGRDAELPCDCVDAALLVGAGDRAGDNALGLELPQGREQFFAPVLFGRLDYHLFQAHHFCLQLRGIDVGVVEHHGIFRRPDGDQNDLETLRKRP
jgi:hypothetical protein